MKSDSKCFEMHLEARGMAPEEGEEKEDDGVVGYMDF